MIAGEGGGKRMWEMVLSGEKEEEGGKKGEWKGRKEDLRRLNVRVQVPLRIKEGAQEFSGAPNARRNMFEQSSVLGTRYLLFDFAFFFAF